MRRELLIRSTNRRGFTLAESLIASVVLAVSVVAVTGAILIGLGFSPLAARVGNTMRKSQVAFS